MSKDTAVQEPEVTEETKTQEEVEDFVDIVFDDGPGPETGRFIECENSQGSGIKLGEWHERDDGFWVLRIPKSQIGVETEAPARNPMPGEIEFGGDLKKVVIDEKKITVSIEADRKFVIQQKIARLCANPKGNPAVKVVGYAADIQTEIDEALEQARAARGAGEDENHNQERLDLDGGDAVGEEDEKVD